MGIIIKDTFTAPDGTLLKNHMPDVGGVWTDTPSVDYVKIFGNRARFQWRNSSNTLTNAALSTQLDCYAQAKIYNISALDYILDLAINYYSVWNLDFLQIRWQAPSWIFYLNTYSEIRTPVEGATYRIERKGSMVYAYENGVQIMSASAGATGHRFRIQMYHQAEIDDYQAGTAEEAAQHLMMVGVG